MASLGGPSLNLRSPLENIFSGPSFEFRYSFQKIFPAPLTFLWLLLTTKAPGPTKLKVEYNTYVMWNAYLWSIKDTDMEAGELTPQNY